MNSVSKLTRIIQSDVMETYQASFKIIIFTMYEYIILNCVRLNYSSEINYTYEAKYTAANRKKCMFLVLNYKFYLYV